MHDTPELRTQRARIRAHKSWGATEDRSARTAPARAAREAQFLEQAGGDPLRAESLRKAFYAEMQYKSVKARQARKREREARKAVADDP